MNFTQLYTIAENLQEFSLYKYKLANRKLETNVLDKYIQNLPDHLQVFGFPYQYAFEENLIKSYGKTLSIWSGEKLSTLDRGGETWTHAKRFLRTNPNCKVYLPARIIYGRVYPLSRQDKALNLSKVLGGETQMARVDFSPWHVQQKLYDLPTKFDIIDLDYVRALDIENFTWNTMAWDRLKPGGLLYVTFAISAYRAFKTVTSKYEKDIDQEELNKFEKQNVIQDPKNKYVTINQDNFKQFGLENEKQYQMYENIINNYIELHFDNFDAPPVFVNIYRGGEASDGGKVTVMCRMVWVKGVSGEVTQGGGVIEQEPEMSDTRGAVTLTPKQPISDILSKDEVFDLYYNKSMNISEIARKFNVSRNAVKNLILRHGGKIRRDNVRKYINPATGTLSKDKIFDMYYNQGMTTSEISKQTNISKTTLAYFIIKHGGKLRKPGKRLKLKNTNSLKDQIFDMYYNQKMSLENISKKLATLLPPVNASERAVSNFIIKNGGKLRTKEQQYRSKLDVVKDQIFDMYYKQNMSLENISKKLAMSSPPINIGWMAIRSFIRKHGGKIRPLGQRTITATDKLSKYNILKMYYIQNMSIRDIAKTIRVGTSVISDYINKHGVKSLPHNKKNATP